VTFGCIELRAIIINQTVYVEGDEPCEAVVDHCQRRAAQRLAVYYEWRTIIGHFYDDGIDGCVCLSFGRFMSSHLARLLIRSSSFATRSYCLPRCTLATLFGLLKIDRRLVPGNERCIMSTVMSHTVCALCVAYCMCTEYLSTQPMLYSTLLYITK